MDIRATLAQQGYAAARPAADTARTGPAADVAGLARDFADTVRAGETTAQEAMAGRADPQALVQALAQTQLAVETAVTVRDRVVEAYQEILRMPV